MKTQLKYLIILLLLIPISIVKSQIFLQENFETTTLPANWGNVALKGSKLWDLGFKGGGSMEYGSTGNPGNPKYGIGNASFYYQSLNRESARLITKPLNMAGASNVELTFWIAQVARYFEPIFSQDELHIYCQKTNSSSWRLLKSYTSEIVLWQREKIYLPDSLLSETTRIAFEGIAGDGLSTCIDSVMIRQTSPTPKIVSSDPIINQFNNDIITTNSTKNFIIKVEIPISGTQGTLHLKNIQFKSLSTDNSDIENVDLYYSTKNNTTEVSLLATTTINSDSTVVFNTLNKELITDKNYFWLAVNIKKTAKAKNIIDFKVEHNKIEIGSNFFPSTEVSPSGSNQIEQSIFSDDFEVPNWTLNGDFQIGTPIGLGENSTENTFTAGFKDPTSAYGGSKVLGNDLSGIGILGNYERNVVYAQNNAKSKVINCRFYTNVKIQYNRYLNVDKTDNAAIEISNDNGVTWNEVWSNKRNPAGADFADFEGKVIENKWRKITHNISQFATRKQNVVLRFVLGSTGASSSASGWNIDNLVVYGDSLTKDLDLVEIISPSSGCGLSSSETVSVKIRNNSSTMANTNIPIQYTLDGLHFVNETINVVIDSLETITYNFATKADFSETKVYDNFYVNVLLPGDQISTNNQKYKIVYSQQSYTTPFTQPFDSYSNFWFAGGKNNTWQLGYPEKSYITGTSSSSNCWITNLFASYSSNDSSYVESPCFDFNSIVKPIISFSYFSAFENPNDGVALQYSIDKGNTWMFVPSDTFKYNWNWYSNDAITSLGTAGWDTLMESWNNARQILPDTLKGKSNVKFRFLLKSDNSLNSDGFAFDNFKIEEAPISYQITSMNTILNNSCRSDNPRKISFSIKNEGPRSIIPNKDKLYVGFRVNNHAIVIDTIIISDTVKIGATATYTFNKMMNLDSAINNIAVFNNKSSNTFYLINNNDTIKQTVTILPFPKSFLPKKISSGKPDTIVLKARIDLNYKYLWNTPLVPSTIASATISSSGKYWCRITQTDNGCIETDTVEVVKLSRTIGVSSIVLPTDACSPTLNINPKLYIKNKGLDTLFSNQSFTVSYIFDGNAPVTSTIITGIKINPKDSVVYTFASLTISMPTQKSYTFKAYTTFADDETFSDDTLKTTPTIHPPFVINLGEDKIVAGSTYKLTGGNGHKAYLWNNNTNTTDSTYIAKTSGKHWVRVTSIYNCIASDTINLSLTIFDIKPILLTSKINCGPSQYKIKVGIENIGSEIVFKTDTVEVKYRIGNSLTYTPPSRFSFADKIYPGLKDSIEFTNPINLNNIQKYPIEIVAKIQGDVNTSNDTIRDTIQILFKPTVDLGGPDKIKALFPYKLSAPKNSKFRYLWNDNSKADSLNVFTTGIYHVKVTDTTTNTRCFDRDTVLLYLQKPDYKIASSTLQSEYCNGDIINTSVLLSNIGDTAILSSETIKIGVIVNRNTPQYYSFTLNNSIEPSQSASFSITDIQNFSVGKDSILIFLKDKPDVYRNNDTLRLMINIKYRPNDEILKTVSGNTNIVDYYNADFAPINIRIGDTLTNCSYNWNNSITTKNILVNNSGKYVVKVTNNNSNCSFEDSVYILVKELDVSIESIQSLSKLCINDFDSVNIVIKNNSNFAISKIDTIAIKVNSELSYLPLITNLNRTILSNSSTTVKIPNLKSKFQIGKNKILARIILTDSNNDFNKNNDTLSYRVFINQSPLINIGKGASETISLPKKLVAGSSLDFAYLWHNGSNQSFYTVARSEKCKVVVTNILNNCISVDSSYFVVNNPDILPLKPTLLESCISAMPNYFFVQFKNIGNNTLVKGTKIMIDYKINSLNYKDSSITAFDYSKNEIADIELKNLKNKLSTGINKILLNIYTSDSVININKVNDTLSFSWLIKNQPIVYLDGRHGKRDVKGVLFTNLPDTLDAGAGNYSYLWNNNEKTQLITIDNPGLYDVIVTDKVSGCVEYDTIDIRVNFADLELSSIVAKDSVCKYDNFGYKAIIRNTGSVNIPQNTNISLTYDIGGVKTINYNSKRVLLPNDTLHININTLELSDNLNVINFSHSFNDKIANNNSKIKSIFLKRTPNIDFRKMLNLTFNNQGIIETKTMPIILNPSVGNGFNYKWNNGSTNSELSISKSGTYRVKVTEPLYGCFDEDSVKVFHFYTDGTISNITAQTPSCINSFNEITATYSITGKDSVAKGEKLVIGYILGTNENEETITLATDVTKSNPYTHKFNLSGKIAEGTNKIVVYTRLSPDKDITNNNMELSFMVNTLPTINLPSQISFTPPYTLDAGPGYKTYLWNNSITTRSIDISTAGIYTLKVTNENDCENSTSIEMKLIEKPIVINPLVKSSNSLDLKIFPNPTSGISYITIPDNFTGNCTIQIYNSQLKLISDEKQAITNGMHLILIQSNTLTKGLYLIKATFKENIYSGKLIVQ